MRSDLRHSPAGVTGVWKTIALTLIGVVVSGSSAWLVFGQRAVGREEVAQMIAVQSPYLEDRKSIAEALEANNRILDRIAADVQSLKVEQARLIERIDGLMDDG
jgi:hypothetical protein